MASGGKKDFSTDGLDILGIRGKGKVQGTEEHVAQKIISEKNEVDKTATISSGVKSVPARRKKKQETGDVVRFTLPIKRENVEYLEAIKALEGSTITEILNAILDEHRARGQEGLNRALEQLEESRRTWRGD